MLQLVLGVLIDELLVVGNNGLGDGLSDGIDLGGLTTTGNTDTDVNTGESVETNDQEGLVDLESQDLRLNQVQRLSVDLDKSLSGLYLSHQYIYSSSPQCKHIVLVDGMRTLQWATAVASLKMSVLCSPKIWFSSKSLPVFFFPKH